MPAVPSNEYLRKYEGTDPAAHPDPSAPWSSKPELPTSSEILNVSDEEFVDVPSNKVDGPWASKNDYLSSHYELLREDAVSPLRDAVAHLADNPHTTDGGNFCVYENVYILGFTFSHLGPAARIVISLARAGKKILWQQSKRLLPGTLVALAPADEGFTKSCIVATIAARPLAGVEQNPAEVDIFFANPEDVQINPLHKWVMVEARTGYFEAYRHSMVAIQRLMTEKFPLSEHLVNLTKECDTPKHVKENPRLDLSEVFRHGEGQGSFMKVDVLKDWPEIESTTLDKSQVSAFRNVLTKELAIVQGPPGTGKTHVSVLALKAILSNLNKKDSPVIITAQTNHALDQLLRRIAAFEPNFIRLGGRTTDQDVVKNRTLHEVRKTSPTPRISGGTKGPALKKLKDLTESMVTILTPLQLEEPLSPELLRNLNIIDDAQCESFNRGAREWVRTMEDNHPLGVMALWLGNGLVRISDIRKPDDFGFEIEEPDLEIEQLKELEAEASMHVTDDNESDSLKGTWFPLRVDYQGEHSPTAGSAIQQTLGMTDMWNIPEHFRGDVYNYLWGKAVSILEASFREKAREYMHVVRNLKLGKWELDSVILQEARVVGMTTTGLSKYRGLVASLKPRIIVVEEAAETLEGLVMSACMESVEHLILVGDHKQLRAHCSVQQLEVAPYNLGISMFERLVTNGVKYSELTRQRRMIPEIRKLLNPIYENLQDHPTVLGRPAVPGMGGINSFFFTHRFIETPDSNASRCNKSECDMLVGFFDYLVLNGVRPEDITVLTFYAGQRKMILKALRNHVNLQGLFFKVATVDSYQGEENKIILLSLVRSNSWDEIGFLSNANRICVALSRAQEGLYLFGNDANLRTNSMWSTILDILSQTPGRLASEFPLTCVKHTTQIWIKELSVGDLCRVDTHAALSAIRSTTTASPAISHATAISNAVTHVPLATTKAHPRADVGAVGSPVGAQKQAKSKVVAAWAAFANGGAAVEDAEIYNRRKAQLIDYQEALIDLNDGELPDTAIRVLESQEISMPSNLENPTTDSTSPNQRVLLADSKGDGEKAVPTMSNEITHVVRRVWREVVSMGDSAPVKPLATIANKAEVAQTPPREEASLLD
ncbi:MAG: hypothetical protein M1839_009112 [Geoglossum umbratile]|nr:MAG: hypothetical protein M1839_009112 [Geoglossum umbratile]